MIATNLILVALLIIATAFFVATEFAIVKIRSSRIDQLVLENRKNAIAVKKVISNLDGYLSACQLGITITALGLGWLGEPTVEKLLHPVLEPLHLPGEAVSFLSFIIAFLLITYLHVVLGELAPKTVAIQKAEQVALMTARPIIFFYKIMYPFIWLLNGSANYLIRLFGMKPAKEHEEAHSEEELRIILSESYESGKINKSEYGYVKRIFAFDDLLAREIMVPRTDMVCLYLDHSMKENLQIIKDEQYTRFPVVKDNKDHIVGMMNTKQFFLHHDDNPNLKISDLLHPVMTVSESMPVKTLLRKMQQERVQMAVLADEYGGTSGIITIEDILEEIVGEIRDEFDTEENQPIEKVSDNHLIVDGKVSITHVNDLLNSDIDSNTSGTIGGWLYGQNAELKNGSEWRYKNLTFIVKNKENHRIRKIEIIKRDDDIKH
ncbi:hemolysin family protein [Paenibacillus sp. sptzw28]|uniref:hemolysin family protein n=1 Tax=Paenibacillus sp. sptzw28 TaxID=715179 RepID=UPI001C6F2B3F|nr:hemolysin family protein [Paenibacillus sp. sptzw28]QYR22015.1 hemolysin family protein [Paenibacillus sp. sptzw28]